MLILRWVFLFSKKMRKIKVALGQLISEWLFGVLNFTKKQRKIWWISAQESKKWSNQKDKGKFLRWFFGKFKTPKSHSEISRPLAFRSYDNWFSSREFALISVKTHFCHMNSHATNYYLHACCFPLPDKICLALMKVPKILFGAP